MTTRHIVTRSLLFSGAAIQEVVTSENEQFFGFVLKLLYKRNVDDFVFFISHSISVRRFKAPSSGQKRQRRPWNFSEVMSR